VSTAKKVKKSKFVVVMRDFNVKIGHKTTTDPANIGPFGLGIRNEKSQTTAGLILEHKRPSEHRRP